LKKLNVEGYIVPNEDKWIYEMFGVSSISPNDLRNFLADANGEEIELRIDCFGGSVWTASDMYSDLRDYEGKSTANIIGLSASASTVMMLGCNKVIASPTAQFMMHNAQRSASGDYRDMEQAAIMLKSVNETIINAYEIKTGMKRKELAAIMNKETWMTAQEAKKYGFIDEINLKEGEILSDIQISAIMEMTGKVYNTASINAAKVHEYVKKLKNIETGNETETETENGTGLHREETQPVIIAQQGKFNELKLKLLGGI